MSTLPYPGMEEAEESASGYLPLAAMLARGPHSGSPGPNAQMVITLSAINTKAKEAAEVKHAPSLKRRNHISAPHTRPAVIRPQS
jgi:hypothetical protein